MQVANLPLLKVIKETGLQPQIAEVHMKGMNSVSPAIYIFPHIEASLVAQRVKSLPAMQETWVQILGLPWRRKWQPTPVFLPGESHG